MTGTGDRDEAGTAALPDGARDVLPVESAELADIEAGLRGEFARFGYREVRTPLLEFADVMDRAQEGGVGPAFRLFDDHGNVLVLRPDLTIPVARLAATRLAAHPGPVRVSYVATAVRPAPVGKARNIEQRQAGAELIGASGPAADAEIIALLVDALRGLGVSDLQLGLNDTSITRAVLDGLGIAPNDQARLSDAARRRNRVAWRRIASSLSLSDDARKTLADLPALRGGDDELRDLSRRVPAAADACASLIATRELLRAYGVDSGVFVDFGVLRDWGYYTGIVFEAYAPGQGVPIAMGGRYDGLGRRFGVDRAAVGFAVVLDELHAALRARGNGTELFDGVVITGGADVQIATARAMRAAGLAAIAAPDDVDAAEELAKAEGWRWVLEATPTGVTLRDRSTGTVTEYPDEQEGVRFLSS